MKKLYILPLLIACSCATDKSPVDPDLQYIRELGYQYAHKYNVMRDNSTEMEKEDFLLDLRSRQCMLYDSVGKIYSDEFIKAFADSVGCK